MALKPFIAVVRTWLRPERLAISVAVGALSLLLLTSGWLVATKAARAKVESSLARVTKRLGVPVDIGRWRLGFGSVVFEDIVVGDEANVVISRVSVDVGLNPFGDSFLALDSLVADRVRVKSPIGRMRGGAARLQTATLGEESTDGAPPSLEKIFQALPVQHLTMASGTIVVQDQEGKPLASVGGAKLSIDKRSRKVLFHAGRVRLRDANGRILSDDNIQGRLEQASEGSDYRFFIRRKLTAMSTGGKRPPNAWSVGGRLRQDLSAADLNLTIERLPSIAIPLLSPVLGPAPTMRAAGSVKLRRSSDGDRITFDARLRSQGARVHLPLLSSEPVGPIPFDLKAKGEIAKTLDVGLPTIAVESATLTIPTRRGVRREDARPVVFQASAVLRPSTLPPQVSVDAAAGTDASTPSGPGLAIDGQIRLVEGLCQDVLDAAPPGLMPILADFRLDGRVGAGVSLAYDSARPEDTAASFTESVWGCRVAEAPYTFTARHLAGPFSIQREASKDDEPIEVSVSPLSPAYTPIDQISKNIGLAFTTSEDAGFWAHKGIDAGALGNALKRNATEGRVAVGGSTITMQTVKNLYLSHDRTLSRKLQEVFLAWHLENILDKQRILEIYLNIVEFGPGLYGITQAAEHYFGKHPFDLSLLESAYLANLLPSPKTRYRYFCDGKLTPTFESMVHGLLRRMMALNRISYDRFAEATNQTIQFNQQVRLAARACSRLPVAAAPAEEW